MIDISEILEKAVLARAAWPIDAAHDFFRLVGQALMADIDWDEDAGEQWARFVRGDSVVAMAWVSAPLLLVDAERASDLAILSLSELSILVTSLEAVEITANRQRLFEVFGDRTHSVALDADCFSAEDLWYATV
jgi:hypothetical protein